MDEAEELRSKLHDQVSDLYWDVGPEAAAPYAEELAELLDPIEDTDVTRGYWIIVWMARGRLDKAVEIGERDLELSIAKLHQDFPPPQDIQNEWYLFNVDLALTGHFLQACRYVKMDLVDAAKTKMEEAYRLSQEFSVPFDEDLQHLWDMMFNGVGNIEDYFDGGDECCVST